MQYDKKLYFRIEKQNFNCKIVRDKTKNKGYYCLHILDNNKVEIVQYEIGEWTKATMDKIIVESGIPT